MKTHWSYSRPGPFGGTITGSLCGRLHSQSQDGMNLTGEMADVTCSFCRKHPRFMKMQTAAEQAA